VHTHDVVPRVDHPRAATDESTPPLIATSTLTVRTAPALANAADGPDQRLAGSYCQRGVDVGLGAGVANDNRSEPRALAGSATIAISTCDGWATPAVHAEPVEHSTPLASSTFSSESPSQPRKGSGCCQAAAHLSRR